MYARVAGELVATAEPLCAPRKRALVGLFTRVCSNMPGLVLQSVERLVANGTLVGPGHFGLARLGVGFGHRSVGRGLLQMRRHGHRRRMHLAVARVGSCEFHSGDGGEWSVFEVAVKRSLSSVCLCPCVCVAVFVSLGCVYRCSTTYRLVGSLNPVVCPLWR